MTQIQNTSWSFAEPKYFRVANREHTLAPPGRHRPRHYDRRTCARSRSRCSRPERGQPKVPFSACRCHILVIDYRWGSMGSNETATATTGGPRVIDVFDGNGCHRDQIIYFFRWQIGPRTPSGIGLRSGGPVDRMRLFLWLSRELWIEIFWQIMAQSNRAQRTLLICMHRWKPPRVRCRRLRTSSSDPRRPQGDLRTTN